MAQVDFYVLRSDRAGGAGNVACKVVEKAWQQGLRVYVHTASEGEAMRLDELLWTFRQDSFVPHALATASGAEHEAVVIGCDLAAGRGRQVLVNLCATLPADTGGFERIAEVVGNDEESRGAARARYLAYRRIGHQLKHHDLQQ